MCGIAGWFSAGSDGGDAARLQAMTDAIAHRGPDGAGYLDLGQASFGHRRLAIIDLDGGAQPMTSADGQIAITFNGEIYNYQSLMADLGQHGACFRSQSDIEVILELYRAHGVRGFERLRGMFAFALWDNRNRTGYLVRDPLGIKPLFWSERAGALAFASEAKAIMAGGHAAKLRERSLHLLLNFRYIPDDSSLFEGIEQLPRGAVWSWREGVIRRELTLADQQPQFAAEGIDALQQSVTAHQVSDVEVGAYLSGGMDSATVVALMRQDNPNVRTFTLDIGDDPAESSNAARTAELLGVHNDLRIGSLAAEARLPKVIWHLEAPKINALQVHAIAGHASASVKVALSGLGGDEIFLGYNAHRIMAAGGKAAWIRHLAQPFGQALAGAVRVASAVPWRESERALLMAAGLGNWSRVYGLLRNLWDCPRLRRWLYGPRMLDAALPDAFSYLADRWPAQSDPVLATRDFEWERKMVNDLLWQEDRCSMAHGLEVRTPFVDAGMKASFWHLDRHQLMQSSVAKHYLKQLLAKTLPAQILARRKSGFQVAAGRFFHDELGGLAREWLSDDRVRSAGLFNPASVRQMLRLPPEKRFRWHYFILYLMLGTHIWLHQFEGGGHG